MFILSRKNFLFIYTVKDAEAFLKNTNKYGYNVSNVMCEFDLETGKGSLARRHCKQ